jgi:Kef-type K+ transport system membrane component KefB
MQGLDSYMLILVLCSMVIISYAFSLLARLTKVPSVLMLLGVGMFLRTVSGWYGFAMPVPKLAIELLGTIGLIMIVLEAGLDLKVNRNKLTLIRDSFWSATVILAISTLVIAYIFYQFVPLPWFNAVVYALPLSIVSSAIVLPSVGHLSASKKEFLVYEASFSDIVGIIFFNAMVGGGTFSVLSIFGFVGGLIGAVLISVMVCALLMVLLVNNKVNVRFFLAFAVLNFVYVVGKLMHIPSLITIMMFGMVVRNWDLFHYEVLQDWFPQEKVKEMRHYLESITAESSFLVRTFFFLLFGFSMDLQALTDPDVIKVGGLVVLGLLLTRFIYLRILHKYNLFPEVLYSPRGLITRVVPFVQF